MRAFIVWSCIVLLAVNGVSCTGAPADGGEEGEGEGEGGVGEGEGEGEDELRYDVADFAAALKTALLECANSPLATQVLLEPDFVEALLTQQTLEAHLRLSLEDDAVEVNLTAYALCLEDLTACAPGSMSALVSGSEPSRGPCEAVFQGTRVAGEPCLNDGSCVSDHFCSFGVDPCGVCAPFAAVGAPCLDGSRCVDIAACVGDGDARTCVARDIPEGQPCDPATGLCEEGLFCHDVDLVCRGTPRFEAGDPCIDSCGGFSTGLICNGGECKRMRGVAPGAPCDLGLDAVDRCQNEQNGGAFCDDAALGAPDDARGTCTAYPVSGACLDDRCATLHARCDADDGDPNNGTESGMCIPHGDAGDSCAVELCGSALVCESELCIVPPGLGEPCASLCAQGLECTANTCVEPESAQCPV